jgi:hypothetical protein
MGNDTGEACSMPEDLRNVYRILFEKTEDDVIMYLKEMEWEGVNWIHLIKTLISGRLL